MSRKGKPKVVNRPRTGSRTARKCHLSPLTLRQTAEHPMKIVKLETFTNEFVGFVRATSETGAKGWGQVSTYNADLT